jgi:RNA-directed DNA polymerase
LGFFNEYEMSFIEKLTKKLNELNESELIKLRSEPEVERFLINAPKKYKVYTIPKRTSGHRVIAQPSKELKEYQRAYLKIQSLPIHDAATAYRIGLSIKENASAHKNNPYLLKLDLENFFNSISNKLFWKVWKSVQPLPNKKDKVLIEKLLFWCPSKVSGGPLVLSIGAPSSPLISNFFMYHFDIAISDFCSDKDIVYTRYADDLTFSTNHKDILFQIPELIKGQLNSLFGNTIKINRKKTKFSSKGHNRHVTGITITNDGHLSLGRERKRYIKHMVHQYLLEKLSREDIFHLKGLLAFTKHIEPAFISSLKEKYSVELINRIFEEQND